MAHQATKNSRTLQEGKSHGQRTARKISPRQALCGPVYSNLGQTLEKWSTPDGVQDENGRDKGERGSTLHSKKR